MGNGTARQRIGEPEHPSLYRPIPCRTKSILDLTPTEKLFHLIREDGGEFGHKPGQFFQISLFGFGEAPISASSSPTRGSFLDLGVRKAGSLTGAMHDTLKPGDAIGVRGPFGTCFEADHMGGKDLLLIAGGCGLAPMRSLIQYCEDRRENFGAVTILYGAQSPDDVLYKDDLAQWEQCDYLECYRTVDNVSDGTCWDSNVGLITTLIPPLTIHAKRTVAVLVGPPGMYRPVIRSLAEKGIPEDSIIVSLERYMKCGVGKCGHCSIEHLYCCLDGPVFNLRDIMRVRGAI
jgi:NAD(P)H-flavin reductase